MSIQTVLAPSGASTVLGTVNLATGESHLGEIGTGCSIVAVDMTRPAGGDVSPYAIGDCINTSVGSPIILSFPNIARVNGGSGYVVKARLLTDQKTNTAQFRVHLFHTTPTAIADNSPYLLLWANRASRIGYLDFPPMTTEDATNSTAAYSLWTGQIHYKCDSASRIIYAVLETKSAFTPTSGQGFYLELSTDNN